MKIELRVTSGARSGHREVFDKPYIGIGRHPMSDLRFDAEKDIDASTRHAAIVKTGDDWQLRDLNSTNGTFVNGEKLAGDRTLKDGDVMRFGHHGPEVSFHVMPEEGDEVIMPAVHVEPRPSKAPPAKKVSKTAPERALVRERTTDSTIPESRTGLLRAEIGAQRSRNRALLITLLIVLLGAFGVVVWQGKTSAGTIQTVTAHADSVSRELAALQRLQAQTDSQVAQLQAQLQAEANPQRQRSLRARIDTAQRRGAAIAQAQEVDFTAIRRANNGAVAIIYARYASDTTRAWTGTAFSLNANGQMLTNGHNVMQGGEAAAEIAIQFSGSRDVHPARVVRVLPDADVALVQLESQGPFPAVAGISSTTLQIGAPIASIGYPGGGTTARLVTGSVTRVLPDSLYEFESFSGVGASGSPIFDRDGRVVAILFGGLRDSDGRQVLALPIQRALRILN